MDNNLIRPYYTELQGHLSQTPSPERSVENTEDSNIWETFNGILEALIKITGDDLSRF